MSAIRIPLSLSICVLSAWAQLPGIDGQPFDIPGSAPLNLAPQNIRCNVTAQPLTVRVEGLAELLGDIVITCQGNLAINPRNRAGVLPPGYNTPALAMPSLNIQVTTSVPVSSRLVNDPQTEALLFVDDATIAAPLPTTAVDQRIQNPCSGAGAVCPLWVSDGRTELINVGGLLVSGPGSAFDPLVGAASVTDDGRGPIVNVFQGRRLNTQTVVFNAVPLGFVDTRGNPRLTAGYNAAKFASPGAIYDGRPFASLPVTRTFRIKNLRGAIAGNASVNSQIFAYIGIQNPSGTLQLDGATATVGQVNQGLVFSLTESRGFPLATVPTLAACVTINRDLAVDPQDADPFNGATLGARFTEGYAAAFRPRGFVPGQPPASDQTRIDFNYGTESGFYNTYFPFTNGLRLAGLVEHGTRLRQVWNNLPDGVRIYTTVAGWTGNFFAPSDATSPSIGAYAIVTDPSGSGPGNTLFGLPMTVTPTAYVGFTPLGGAPFPAASFLPAGATTGIFPVPSAAGRAVQVWEVYAADTSRLESIAFPTIHAYRAPVAPATITMQGTFAPLNAAAATVDPVPAPRFVESGSPLTGTLLSACLTNLLFPFVTNQAGFNTGIAISNTSLSNPGTGELLRPEVHNGQTPQAGACSLNYFGTTGADGAAPPPASTAVIPAGRTFVMTLSSGSSGPLGNVPPAANFQGFLIAQCNFRYAHGYAFISDMGANLLAQGYLALVMDSSSILVERTGVRGETLGN